MSYINIKGGKELIEALRTFPEKIQRKVMQQALLDGARIIAEEAKQNVPVDSGDLKNSIKALRGGNKNKKGQIMARVRAGNKKAYYAHMIEFGTAAHVIKSKNGGKGVESSVRNHPGTKANPFMRTALDNKEREAVLAVGNRIGEFLRTNNVAPSVDFEVE